MKIIPKDSTNSNEYLSVQAVVRGVTTSLKDYEEHVASNDPLADLILKGLNSTERAFLKQISILASYYKKTCYRAIIAMGKALKGYGARRAIGRTQAYKIYNKLYNLRLIAHFRRHRRATYDTYLAPKGLAVFFQLRDRPYLYPTVDIRRKAKVTLPVSSNLNLDIDKRPNIDSLSTNYHNELQSLVENYGGCCVDIAERIVEEKRRKGERVSDPIMYMKTILPKIKLRQKGGKMHQNQYESPKQVKSLYENREASQTREVIAMELAKAELLRNGILYPHRANYATALEAYDAQQEYVRMEQLYFHKHLKQLASDQNKAPDGKVVMLIPGKRDYYDVY